jgi:hypothetical protein
MLDFNRSITDIIDSQATTRKTSAFVTYSNKKQIIEAGELTEEHKKFIKDLKGTFSFSLHTSGKYLIVTLFVSREKKYKYLVVDLKTMNCTEVESIKVAKYEVMELVNNSNKEIVEEKVEDTEPKNTNKKSKSK